MSAQPLPSAFDPVEYHWIITIQRPNGIIETFDDVFTPDPSMTRSQIFHGAVDALKAKYGVTQLAVLHWELAPNRMIGGAS